eukprot:g7040.t1
MRPTGRTSALALLFCCRDSVGVNVFSTTTFLKQQKQDDWVAECDGMHGLVSPYYVPPQDFMTKVVCVPLMCENKLGKSDDVAVGTAAPCTWEGGEDSCCTDKVVASVDGPCASGSLPCVLGEVSSLDDYTLHAVKQANATDVEAIKADCGTAASDFAGDAEAATKATGIWKLKRLTLWTDAFADDVCGPCGGCTTLPPNAVLRIDKFMF